MRRSLMLAEDLSESRKPSVIDILLRGSICVLIVLCLSNSDPICWPAVVLAIGGLTFFAACVAAKWLKDRIAGS
jgi:hypothetical protein